MMSRLRLAAGRLLHPATQTAASGARGEAGPGAAATTVGLAVDGVPEGGRWAPAHLSGRAVPSPDSRPPAWHPELDLAWRPAPDLRGELNDIYLAGILATWADEVDR